MVGAVLFDFDFTLADSFGGVAESVNHALRSLGLPEAEHDAIRRTVGLSLPRTFEQLRGPADPTTIEAFCSHFAARADQVMVDSTRVFPEAFQAVARLRAVGLRTAVVSTKYRYRIEGILERVGLLQEFDVIVGGEDVANHKPHPEGLLLATAELALPTSLAVYVGDHPVDAEAAQRAAIRFLCVLGGGASRREEFAHLPVGHFLESLAELPAVLTNL